MPPQENETMKNYAQHRSWAYQPTGMPPIPSGDSVPST